MPTWYLGCPVKVSAPMVRPWKLLSVDTSPTRSVWPSSWQWRRASLMSASLASVPVLQKYTRSKPVRRTSSPASSTARSVKKRLDVWISVAAWSAMALASTGCAWPTESTAMPPEKSRYSLPSTSQSRQPCPRVITMGGCR